MKSINQKALLLATLIVLSFVSAFAGTRNQATFTLSQPAKLAGVQLAQGEYMLKWEGEGQSAKFTILQDKKVLGTGTGELQNKSDSDGVTVYLNSAADGSKLVTRIDLPKKSLVLQPN
jgi:hypothetical protein